MQPPRPFQGVPYDKDMFTFLPALTNRDVLVESPRKRKFMASNSQFTIPAPTMGYGSYVNLNPTENAGDLQTNKLQSFIPASSTGDSLTFRNHMDNARFEHQNDSGAPRHSNERDIYESRPECHGYSSFPGQSQSNNYSDSLSLTQNPAGLMYKSSIWSPLVTEDFNQHRTHVSDKHVGEEENHFRFSNVKRLNSSDLAFEESQNLQSFFPKPGAYNVGLDKDSCHERSYKAETFPKMEVHGDSSNFARVDCPTTLGNSFSTSIHNLGETNRILQQALRLLSASSGTSLIVNLDGSSQGSRCDALKINSTPDSQTQNASHFSVDGTPTKGNEAGLNRDKTILSVDKGSANVLDVLKSENGGLPFAEKLWDGILQLSSSVSVSAVAFFKSGERMQDFSWSGSVEVKGKVRLEAFEKYVQDLPRSRSRGLMVMSLWGKDGSSTTSLKAMTEVARKYREGKKVGFAQLNKGLDMYICPHSDTVITILAKHGFFNGMTAVTEKSDPLIGCVVWRKHSTSAPTTEATMIDASHSETSPSKQSEGNSEKMETEIIKHNSSLTRAADQSLAFSDDEDLPEYDFEAGISRTSECKSSVTIPASMAETEQVSVSHVHQPIADQMRLESSTVSQTLPDARFQGQPQNMQHQSVLHNSSIQSQQETESQDCFIAHQPEITIPSWTFEEKRPVDNCSVTMKTKNLFDDDDIPEWCPPDLKSTIPEVTERPRPGPSMAPRFSFTDLATGRQLPTPPPLPPLPPPPRQLTPPPLPLTPHPGHLLPPPPPLPPTPHPDHRPQFSNSDHSAPRPLPPTPHPDHRPHFSNKHHSSPRVPSPAVNNFMHNRPVAPPTQVRSQDQCYPPTPPLPSSMPEKTTASNFPQMQFQSNDNPSAPPARSQADRYEAEGFRHEVLPLPPGFTSTPGFRPQFHWPGVNSHTPNSAWRSSRP